MGVAYERGDGAGEDDQICVADRVLDRTSGSGDRPGSKCLVEHSGRWIESSDFLDAIKVLARCQANRAADQANADDCDFRSGCGLCVHAQSVTTGYPAVGSWRLILAAPELVDLAPIPLRRPPCPRFTDCHRRHAFALLNRGAVIDVTLDRNRSPHALVNYFRDFNDARTPRDERLNAIADPHVRRRLDNRTVDAHVAARTGGSRVRAGLEQPNRDQVAIYACRFQNGPTGELCGDDLCRLAHDLRDPVHLFRVIRELAADNRLRTVTDRV